MTCQHQTVVDFDATGYGQKSDASEKLTTENNHLLELAAKYVWWTSPEITVSENIDKLVTSVMELGTWDDTVTLLDTVGSAPFLDVLDAPPAGAISDKSLAVWHHRLGRKGAAPKLGHIPAPPSS